jgi:lipoate-protein ligase A
LDPVPRSGPDNMAVDEWLLETTETPVLRIYGWNGQWGSLGCFCCLKQAIDQLPEHRLVRRQTGGGIVDHQQDWTYSLVITKNESLFRFRAVESYKLIHQVICNVLSDSFKLVQPVSSEPELGGVCFERPVAFDVVDAVGNKIAGAGQRRTKDGFLHQGSILGRCIGLDSIKRSFRLAEALSSCWKEIDLAPPSDVIRKKVEDRFGNDSWTLRR